jgi:hypothetical protein
VKKVIRLTESDLTRIVKRTINETNRDEPMDIDLTPKIMNMLKPLYEESGTEGVVLFLIDLIETIEDIGDEAFMGPEDY